MIVDEFYVRRGKKALYMRWTGARFSAYALDPILSTTKKSAQAVASLNKLVHIEQPDAVEAMSGCGAPVSPKNVVSKSTFDKMIQEAERKVHASVIWVKALSDGSKLILRVYRNDAMHIEVYKVNAAFCIDGVPRGRFVREWCRRNYALNDSAMVAAIQELTTQRVK